MNPVVFFGGDLGITDINDKQLTIKAKGFDTAFIDKKDIVMVFDNVHAKIRVDSDKYPHLSRVFYLTISYPNVAAFLDVAQEYNYL